MKFNEAFGDEPQWRQFELLVGMLLADYFHIPYTDPQQLVTQGKSDGGYDGIFEIKHWESDSPLFTIVFECKLRSSVRHDLPLQEFSKAMIIAVNMAAQHLVIGTNLHLSTGTVQKLDQFSRRTGLQWSFLGAKEIADWIEARKRDNAPVEVPDRLNDLLARSLPYCQPLERPAQHPTASRAADPWFISDRRKLLCEKVSTAFAGAQSGIVLVSGESGIGKSFFCEALITKVEQNSSAQACRVDLAVCETPRVLFEKLLEHFWAVQVELIFSMDAKDLREATAYVGAEKLDPTTQKALLEIFCQSEKVYGERADLYNQLLIKYLMRIFLQNSARWHPFFYFFNTNHITAPVFTLLLAFLKEFCRYIPMILELRTSLYSDNRMPAAQWQDFLAQARRLPQITPEILIERPLEEEVYFYINNRSFPQTLTFEAKREIYRYVGYKPLYLSAFVSWASVSHWIENTPRPAQAIRIRELMIEGEAEPIMMLLTTLCLQDSRYADIFFLTVLFNNILPVEAAMRAVGEAALAPLESVLIKNSLYSKVDGTFFVQHTILFEHMKRLTQPTDCRREELARIMAPHYKTWVLVPDQRTEVEINLLDALQEDRKLVEAAVDYSVVLYEAGQFFLCSRYAQRALSACRRLQLLPVATVLDIERRLKVLLVLLQVSGFVENHPTNVLAEWINEAQAIWAQWKTAFHPLPQYGRLASEYAMILNRYFLQHGENNKAYDLLKQALDEAQLEPALYPEDAIPHLAWEFAIITKTIHTQKKGLAILKKWKRIYPESLGLQVHYNTQKAEFFFARDLKRAEHYTKKNYALKEQIGDASTRARFSLAYWNVQLFKGAYDVVALQASQELQKLEEAGLRSELGRLLHLQACAWWMQNNPQKAWALFRQGENAFKKNPYYSNEWPLLLDAISFSLEQKDWAGAQPFAQKLQEMFLKMYGSQATRHNWEGIDFSSEEFPKSLVGALVYADALYQFSAVHKEAKKMMLQLKKEIQNPLLQLYFDQADPPAWLKRQMAEMTYLHRGRWIIGC